MHGIIVAERNKLLRAMIAVQQALAGQLTVDEYRSLLGFLEHLNVLLDRPRVRMYGLYRPLRLGHEIDGGPACWSVSMLSWRIRLNTGLQLWLPRPHVLKLPPIHSSLGLSLRL